MSAGFSARHASWGAFTDASQSALDSLRSDQSGTCWWCGGVADSREHKHKASLLRKMWGPEGLVLGRRGDDFYNLRSPRSSVVKFGKTLCQNCNNAKSQPFDVAYDTYAAYVQTSSRQLARAGRIDWRDVFGEDWEHPTRNLGCYFVKSFGCWFAEDGFPPPSPFAAFLDGDKLVDTRIMPLRQQSATLAQRALRLDGEATFDRGIGTLDSVGWIDAAHTRLTGYKSFAYIADICMRLNWAGDAGVGELFWDEPVVRLEVMPAMPSQRVIAAKIAVRALARRARNAISHAPR